MIRLMTLNIQMDESSHGDWSECRELIAGAVRLHSVDIIALQAVRSGLYQYGEDQAAQLALATGFDCARFLPGVLRPPDGIEGSAFLSLVHPECVESRVLARTPQDEKSECQVFGHAAFQTDFGALHIFNAHLPSCVVQSHQNMIETLKCLEEVDGSAALVGDFGCVSGDEMACSLEKNGWQDAWGPRALSKRLDQIWVNQELKTRLVSIDTVFSSGSAARLSNHQGLIAVFQGNLIKPEIQGKKRPQALVTAPA